MSAELVILGDEGWTQGQWEARQRKLERDRRYDHEHRAERTAYHRGWTARNREHVREYNREWMREHRPQALHSKRKSAHRLRPVLVGSLHDLACTGPTKATGCCCHKIRVYDKPKGGG